MTTSDPTSPGDIFLNIIDQIDLRLEQARRPRAFKKPQAANDVRRQLFQLEGWAKIHRHWPVKREQKIFNRIRTQCKRLEGAFGALDLAVEIAGDLRAKGQTDIALLIDVRERTARDQLKNILKSEGWFTKHHESRTAKMRRQLGGIDWPSTTGQCDFLLHSITQDLRAVDLRYRKELKSKLLKSPYDQNILEQDLHKFRRQLRWFAIYIQSADGLIRLGPVSDRLTAEKKKLVAEYQGNPFAILPSKSRARAQIDAVSFYELIRLVDVLGGIKDRAERYFYILDTLASSGISEYQAASRAQLIYGDAPNEAPNEVRVVVDEYERMKPLSYLSESLTDT